MDTKRLLRSPLVWIAVVLVLYLGYSYFSDETRGYVAAADLGRAGPAQGRQRHRGDHRRQGAAAPARPDQPRSTARTRSTRQYPAGATDEIFNDVQAANISGGYNTTVTSESTLFSLLIYLIPVGLIILFLLWMMNNAQGGGNKVLSFGKSKAKLLTKDMPVTKFTDVAGADEAVAGTRRDPRLPGQPGPLPGARREDPQGRAALRPARHRQDAAGARGRRRGRGAVLLDLRLRLRRDVRRRRRLPGPRPVRAGQGERPGDHLRRRDRRRRPAPRRRHGRRSRRARADAEPAAGRDGRLRGQGRHHPDRRHQPARHPRPGAAAAGPVRPADPRRPARPEGPAGDPGRALQGQAVRARRRLPAAGQAHRRHVRRRPGQRHQRGGAAHRPRARHGDHQRRARGVGRPGGRRARPARAR